MMETALKSRVTLEMTFYEFWWRKFSNLQTYPISKNMFCDVINQERMGFFKIFAGGPLRTNKSRRAFLEIPEIQCYVQNVYQ